MNFCKIENIAGKTLDHTMMTVDAPEGQKHLKTLWEKEKMLEASIFSFSHNIFYHIKGELFDVLVAVFSVLFTNALGLSSANAADVDRSKSVVW